MDSIKALGMNIIVVWPGVFWWEDGIHPDYPFHTGKEILNYAEKIGLEIVMELAGQITSLEYAPDFVMKQEYLAVNENGTLRNHVRNYDYINYFHPEVKNLIKKNFQDTAAAYKGFPALYGYDIWNETMWKSYDGFTIQVFRNWLEKKYGTIAALNDSWDRVYHDWSQIEYTSWIWASTMPMVDFFIFSGKRLVFF
jgi:beta-galactosidase GanA